MADEVEYILDASALLCLIKGEPGAERVHAVLAEAAISSINLTEVVTKLSQRTGDPAEVRRLVGHLHLRVLPWGEAEAWHSTRFAWLAGQGLSLGDRACITECEIRSVKALTCDKRWAMIAEISERVLLIR